MTFEEYVNSKIINKSIEHFDLLYEAVIQTKFKPTEYITAKGIEIDRRKVSRLYNQMFDLSEKNNFASVNHWLYKQYLPDDVDRQKYCKDCEQDKPITEFYSNGYTPNGTRKYKPICKKCTQVADSQKFYYNVTEFFEVYECNICGYDDCYSAIDFHHLDPSKKEYQLNQIRTSSKEKLFKELEKGVLLCANCHREVHAGMHPEYLVESQ